MPVISLTEHGRYPQGVDDEATLEALNEQLMNRINAHGRFFLSHSQLQGKYTMRIAIGNLRTSEQDIQNLWKELQEGLAAEAGPARSG